MGAGGGAHHRGRQALKANCVTHPLGCQHFIQYELSWVFVLRHVVGSAFPLGEIQGPGIEPLNSAETSAPPPLSQCSRDTHNSKRQFTPN
jgi:hypothetical protein